MASNFSRSRPASSSSKRVNFPASLASQTRSLGSSCPQTLTGNGTLSGSFPSSNLMLASNTHFLAWKASWLTWLFWRWVKCWCKSFRVRWFCRGFCSLGRRTGFSAIFRIFSVIEERDTLFSVRIWSFMVFMTWALRVFRFWASGRNLLTLYYSSLMEFIFLSSISLCLSI